MKKLVILLLALCLVLGGIAGASELQRAAVSAPPVEEVPYEVVIVPEEEAAPAEQPEEAEAAPAEQPEEAEAAPVEQAEEAPAAAEAPDSEPAQPTVASGRLDFKALYALHDPDEPVLRVGEKEESWGDYFYILYTQCGSIENYFDTMANYGMPMGWTDPIEEGSEENFADAALEGADNLMIQLRALEKFAEDNGIELTEEKQQEIADQKKKDAESALGEGATEEEFQKYLDGIYLRPEMYTRIVTQNILYQESFKELYGENGEKLPEETAIRYLEDNGYVSAAHILLSTKDSETGEALTEEQMSEKRAILEALVEELRAIEDPEERALNFFVKMDTLSEDPGKSYYPEGYTYMPGSMVTEFENAAEALEDYAVSDVIETSYGYHVLLRLPLSAEAIVEYSNTDSTARTARMLAANQEYSDRLQEVADALELSWLDGTEAPDLLQYVAE